MPDQWMKNAAEEIVTYNLPVTVDPKPYKEWVVAIIARHYAEREQSNRHVIEEMAKLMKASAEHKHVPLTFRSYVKAAAYLHDGEILTLPAPARHHHLVWAYGDMPGSESGFLTDCGRFVDRSEAWDIARDAGQITRREGQIQGTLYSEDVW